MGKWQRDITTSNAWKLRPVLPAEEYYAFATIQQLKADYPFTDKPEKLTLPRPSDWQQEIGLKYFQKQIDWLTLMNQSYQGYLKERNVAMIMKTSKIIADAMPQNDVANYRVGKQLLQSGQSKLSLNYFKKALLEKPEHQPYILAVSNLQNKNGAQ